MARLRSLRSKSTPATSQLDKKNDAATKSNSGISKVQGKRKGTNVEKIIEVNKKKETILKRRTQSKGMKINAKLTPPTKRSIKKLKTEEPYPSPPLSSSLKGKGYNSRISKKKVDDKAGLVKGKSPKDLKKIKLTCTCNNVKKRGRPSKKPCFCTCGASRKSSKALNNPLSKANTRANKKTFDNPKISVKEKSKPTIKKTSKATSKSIGNVKSKTSVSASKKVNISQKSVQIKSEKLEGKGTVAAVIEKKVLKYNFAIPKSTSKPKLSNKLGEVQKASKPAKKSAVSDVDTEDESTTPVPPPRKEPVISEYEIKRQALIDQNRLFLESLNLGAGLGFSLSTISEPAIPKPLTKVIKPPSSKKRTTIDYSPRKSRRLEGKPAPLYSEKELEVALSTYREPRLRTLKPEPRTSKPKPKSNHVNAYKRKGKWRAKKAAPQEISIEEKQETILMAKKRNYSKVPMPDKQDLDLTNLKDFSLETHCLKDCSDEISVQDNFGFEIKNKLSQIHEVTPQPVKLIGPIPTAIDVHSDSQRFVLAMGNRSGEVAIWNATNVVLSKGEEGVSHNGLLYEGASILHHQAYEGRVWGLKFQPEYSAKLLQAGGDGSLRTFDIHKEILAPVCQMPLSGEYMTNLGFTDPHTAAFTTSHGFLGFHDLRTTSHALNLNPLNDTAHLLWSMAINPVNPHIVAVGSSDRTLSIWDTRYLNSKPKPIVEQQYSVFVTSLDWDPRGKRLSVFAYDDIIRVFDASNLNGNLENELQLNMTAHYSHDADPWRKGVPVQARFHPDPNLDGRVIMSGAMGVKVNYFDSATSRSLGYFNGRHFPAASPAMLAFHPKASIDSHPFGSGIVNGTLSGRVFILV